MNIERSQITMVSRCVALCWLWSPSEGRVVVLHARLHVLELVEHGEHVDELAEREQVGFAHELALLLRMTQSPHLRAKRVNRFILSFCVFFNSFLTDTFWHVTPFLIVDNNHT